MTPSHARKGGKRYRYDVTRLSALIHTGAIACRISAPEAERIVIDRLTRWPDDRSAILTVAGAEAAGAEMALVGRTVGL